MSSLSKEERKKRAKKIIESYIKEGDVINIIGHPKFYRLDLHIAYFGIRKTQKNLFGRVEIEYIKEKDVLVGGGEYVDKTWLYTHSMLYFKKNTIKNYYKNKKIDKKLIEGGTFSVEPPRALYIPVDDYALDDISVFRYTKKKLTKKDVTNLLIGTESIVGTKYDYGQLMNILINDLLGYPYKEKVKWFDLGAKRKVCSVGVASAYLNMTKNLDKNKYYRLFSILNDKVWKSSFIKEFKENGGYWSIENTYPIMFALSGFFNYEFELILKMKNGYVEYLREV